MEQTLADPTYQDISESQKVKLLEKNIKRLISVIRSGELAKLQLKKQVNEL